MRDIPHNINGRPITNLEQAFQKLNTECVKISKSDRVRSNRVLYHVLDALLERMQEADPLFRAMKPRLEYIGSYFDGLRVGAPTEYDINVILKLPLYYRKIVLDAAGCPGGYTALVMPPDFDALRHKAGTQDFRRAAAWCDAASRLSVLEVRAWMQGCVAKALNTLPEQGDGARVLQVKKHTYLIKTRTSGPANTMIVLAATEDARPKKCLGGEIEVDLVPAFSFDYPKVAKNSSVTFDKVGSTRPKTFFVIPKPTVDSTSWRMAFPQQERFILKNKFYLKSTLKLLKLVRDAQGFEGLASYYIKTIFLWAVEKMPDDIWKRKSLAFLTLHMLKRLKEYLSAGIIPNYWSKEQNLLENIKRETIENWSNRLTIIIEAIEKEGRGDPCMLFEYFGN